MLCAECHKEAHPRATTTWPKPKDEGLIVGPDGEARLGKFDPDTVYIRCSRRPACAGAGVESPKVGRGKGNQSRPASHYRALVVAVDSVDQWCPLLALSGHPCCTAHVRFDPKRTFGTMRHERKSPVTFARKPGRRRTRMQILFITAPDGDATLATRGQLRWSGSKRLM